MNGLGNDFVVVESRDAPFAPTAEEVRAIADRAAGIGCDQLISIEQGDDADARVRFWNADGEEVGACGNGTRCVGWLLMEEGGKDRAVIETRAGVLWTSHNMYEVAETCGRVLFLSRGKVLLEGSPEALIAHSGAANLEDLFVEVAHEHPATGEAVA